MKRAIKIVGGGIAGLALANKLATENIKVEVYEKRKYPFHRVCGEFVCGASDKILEDLGIICCFKDSIRIKSMAWFLCNDLVFEQELPTTALGISRFLLDSKLADSARNAGAIIHHATAFRGQDHSGLVWARGKQISRQSDWIGLSAHFENINLERLEMYCGSRGYLGISPIENNRVNVTGLFKKSTFRKFSGINLLLAYLNFNNCDDVFKRLNKGRYVDNSFTAITGFSFGQQRKNGFSIGDNSLLIPPFSGNGMSMALEAAAQASKYLIKYSNERISWDEACRRHARYEKESFRLRMGVSTCLHPFLFSPFGLSAMRVLSRIGFLPVTRLYNALR